MRSVQIGKLKARLSEFLGAVRSGESILVLHRNTAIAQILPIPNRLGLRIRKPAVGSPAPNKVQVLKLHKLKIDVVGMLFEERQRQR
jgi:antitoxin (DNA-binding transcriptional repressor) of toxin-antitoxin stability system